MTSVDFDVRVRNPTVTATIEADDEASKYATGDHGEDVAVMGAQSASIEFSVKMSSTNGTTSPKWWKFAEACGCEIKTYENGSSAVIGKALQYCRNWSLIMAKTVYCILLLCTLSFSGWERVTEYTPWATDGYLDLRTVFFLDTLNGWIGGQEHIKTGRTKDHYLAYTTDGGLNWTEQFVDSSLHLILDLFFVDRNVGWLTGLSHDSKGMIVNTTDGGKTWNTVLSDSSLRSPRKILFPTPSVGYFFTYNNPVSLVGKTIDGGKNWSIKDGRLDWWGLFEDAFFINADTGFAVGEAGGSGFVNRTVDGGTSWETLFPRIDGKSLPNFASVFFLDSKRGWVGGYNYTIAYTADGGNTWEIQKDGSADGIYPIEGLHFVNDTVGWATGWYQLYFTQNGGKTWASVTMDTTFQSKRMHFVIPNHGWIVGGYNTVYRTTDNGGHPQAVSVLPNMRNKYKSSFNNIRLASVQSRGVIKVHYSMVSDGSVSISVYDLKGSKIVSLPEKIHLKGEHCFSFKASRGFYLLDVRGRSSGKEIKAVEKIFVN